MGAKHITGKPDDFWFDFRFLAEAAEKERSLSVSVRAYFYS